MAEQRVGEPKLSPKEIRRLIAPFLEKELDLEQLNVLCGEGSRVFQETKNSPEFAAAFAEKLGFNKLVVNGHVEAPLGRDPRNIFERLSHSDETHAYHPGSHSLLLKIVANGLSQAKAEKVINSVFSPDCRGNFPDLNFSLKINPSSLMVASTPQWVKDMPCFQDIAR